MRVQGLKRRLLEGGCNPVNFSVGRRGSDVFCLENQDGMWRVFYTKRGRDDDPIFESASEEEACQYYFDYITTKVRHDHLVGFFKVEEGARVLMGRLAQHGIRAHQDKIPYGGWVDPRFRVFVVGKDIFKVRKLLEVVPLKD